MLSDCGELHENITCAWALMGGLKTQFLLVKLTSLFRQKQQGRAPVLTNDSEQIYPVCKQGIAGPVEQP